MTINQTKGNMYEFVTHTWNAIKGACLHDCTYCYMKRWGKLNPVRLDEKELKCSLGKDNFIFVGSSCDMFADDIPAEWILKTLEHCRKFDNKYLFQSKNPKRMLDFVRIGDIPKHSVFCTTIESNRVYPEIMRNSPHVYERAEIMRELSAHAKVFVTIEPIMDFDLPDMIDILKICNANQINIGADSGGNKLPEPSKEKLLELIEAVKTFSTIDKKRNLERLLK